MGVYIFTQHLVDVGLVVAAALGSGLLAEPIQHVLIQADGDAFLAGGQGENRATLAFGKIEFGFHFLFLKNFQTDTASNAREKVDGFQLGGFYPHKGIGVLCGLVVHLRAA